MAIMRDVPWHFELLAPPTQEPVTVAVVRDDHLKSPNGSLEDAYIARLILVARRMAERTTRRALMPQAGSVVLDRFPSGEIVLPWPPLQRVESITYVDTAGVEQTLAAEAYQVSAPQGPTAPRGRIWPAYGTTWPSTRSQMDAVVVSFDMGYPLTDPGSPPSSPPEEPQPTTPDDIVHGMLLVIGELYKQRSESVHTTQTPAVIRARDLWMSYRVY